MSNNAIVVPNLHENDYKHVKYELEKLESKSKSRENSKSKSRENSKLLTNS